MASAVVAFKGAPMAGLVKEVSAAPSDAFKGAPLAGGLLKPAAPFVPGRSTGSALRLLRSALDLFVTKLFSTDALDAFGEPAGGLAHLLALTKDGGVPSGTGFFARGWWVSKEDDDAMQLKVAMPGLRKEHVKISAKKNILVIKGEGDKDSEDGDDQSPALHPPHPAPRRGRQDGTDQGGDEGWDAQGHRAHDQG
ncbi:hypothetical protein BAE44_0014659 [Dichanthelium oligosanthes]|uniref:SHSP domain-containing protein n=1 Tax=Dichanthelium oligosanthes TaxID=888268 RepID=A0A1E5VGS5_9POAL|nr:hypothetical protein BAE44_0014659 [Dichanthelium oligosanthes]